MTGARDPATGQAVLDRRIPQIVASMPKEEAAPPGRWHWRLIKWYLILGFLDRYFELILDLNLTDSARTDVDEIVYRSIVFRRFGFTAHPKYLEVAELLGIIELWEQRGAPDFCEKVGGKWICE